MKRIGIDVGGTFTDVILIDDANGTVVTTKVPTTPRDPAEGAVNGVRRILELAAARGSEIGFIGHGSTIATNMLVEGKGARAALVTTKGFRDILEIRRVSRHDRADLYDLFFTNPPPLVPGRHRIEADERVLFDGAIGRKLAADETERVVGEVERSGADAVAVCLINSHANPAHEEALVEALRKRLPKVFATASTEVNPEIYEYERTSTTVINAMLGPRCGSYIRNFERSMREAGVKGDVLFMQSNGGLARGEIVAQRPVALLESGPAGGVTAAAKLCERLKLPNAITGDMGGTTFDVSLIRDYRAETRSGGLLHTHAVRFPTIDIESIGAGGGSIAWIDAGGGIHVGPQSAGADPGPACYGRGGDRPTVTDCNLVLGYVDPETFLGGEFRLDGDAAHRVVEKALAKPLGVSVVEAAGIVRAVANALMAQATRLMTVERGYDPREFAYICYGGAGPVHAIDLAADLEIPTVVVPRLPGLFSAFGMLVADQSYDFQIPILKNLDEVTADELAGKVAELARQVKETLRAAGLSDAGISLRPRVDCRYLGQAESLAIDLPGETVSAATLRALHDAFESEHRRHWNFTQPDRPISLVNLRLQAVFPTSLAQRTETEQARGAPKPMRKRSVFVEGERVALPVYARDELRFGHELEGPGIVEEASSSLVFTAGRRIAVDAEGNLIVKIAG
jgi:N-methylhydantoinase A